MLFNMMLLGANPHGQAWNQSRRERRSGVDAQSTHLVVARLRKARSIGHNSLETEWLGRQGARAMVGAACSQPLVGVRPSPMCSARRERVPEQVEETFSSAATAVQHSGDREARVIRRLVQSSPGRCCL